MIIFVKRPDTWIRVPNDGVISGVHTFDECDLESEFVLPFLQARERKIDTFL